MAFIASKTLGYLLLPGNFLFFTLAVGLILLWRGHRKWGLRMAAGATALLLFLGLFPVGQWLLEPLEARFPAVETLPDHIDGIIVLGGAIDRHISLRWGQASLKESAERMTSALALAKHYPKARILFTGGIGSISQSGPSTSVAAAQFFREQGIDTSRLVIEAESRNTYENAILTKALIGPAESERWLLITSAFHMPRSVGCFRHAGWRIIPYPVDYRTSDRGWGNMPVFLGRRIWEADTAIHAWIGLIAYYLMDRTSELLPGPNGGPD